MGKRIILDEAYRLGMGIRSLQREGYARKGSYDYFNRPRRDDGTLLILTD